MNQSDHHADATPRDRFRARHPGCFYLDPGEPDLLENYLRSAGVVAAGEVMVGAARAGEGNMNCTVRVTSNTRSVIVKQARPWVEKYPRFDAPWDRARGEIEFYQRVASQPGVAGRMPRLLHGDRDARLLVLEDVGAGRDLSVIYQGLTLDLLAVDELTDYLAALHHRFQMDSTRRPFPNRAMRALNHAHIFDIPLQHENGLDLDGIQPGLRTAAEIVKSDAAYVAAVRELGRVIYLADGDCLVHGDFFPGSFLSTPAGPRVIDPEFAHYGRSEFDGGVFLAHLLLGGQPPGVAARFLERYPPPPGHDQAVMLRLAGVEIMRRLIGYAQLPLVCGLSERRALLWRSRELVLRPNLELILQP